MPSIAGFTPEDAQRIAAVVREFERRLHAVERQLGNNRASSIRVSITGRLAEELERGGVAALTVYQLSATGGLGDATGEEYDIVDSDELASASSPLEVNVRCTAIWCDGLWKLVSFDCDLDAA